MSNDIKALTAILTATKSFAIFQFFVAASKHDMLCMKFSHVSASVNYITTHVISRINLSIGLLMSSRIHNWLDYNDWDESESPQTDYFFIIIIIM